MLVKEAMKRDVKGVTPDQSIEEAAKVMKEFDVGSLPVLENGRPVGIITDRDIVVRCVAEGKKLQKTKVEDCMTKDMVTITENRTMEDASKMMCDNKIRRLVVVDENSAAIGFLNMNHIGEKTNNPDLVMDVIHRFQ